MPLKQKLRDDDDDDGADHVMMTAIEMLMVVMMIKIVVMIAATCGDFALMLMLFPRFVSSGCSRHIAATQPCMWHHRLRFRKVGC